MHVVSPRAHLGRSGAALLLTNEEEKQKFPIEQLDSVVVHGFAQVSTQAIHLCAQHGVAVQWFTAGGRFAAGTACSPGRVQQRLRQYAGLSAAETRLDLARRLVAAKIDTQRRYVLRASRSEPAYRAWCRPRLEQVQKVLRDVPRAQSASTLLGLEGTAARAYFDCLKVLVGEGIPEELRPDGRNRRPPRDRFNCLLSFGYALLQSLTYARIVELEARLLEKEWTGCPGLFARLRLR